jgi:hypothetical protein
MKLTIPGPLTAAQAHGAIRELRRFTVPQTGAPYNKPARSVVNLDKFSQLWWNGIVVGYGLAEERTDHRPTGRLATRFYVTRKLPKARLKSPYLIPRWLRIRTSRKGKYVDLPTDVVEMRRLPAAQRTVEAGDSMGHVIGVRGTFGLSVRDGSGQTYALTCAHVAAPDFVENLQDTAVESPADSDGVAGPNVMGTVFSWTALDPVGFNTADAALVKPAAGITLSNDALGLAPSPRFSTLTASQFAGMKKSAAIVQTQRGAVSAVVDSIANDLLFDFGRDFYRFTDVASYVASVEPGDSGSAVVDAVSRDVLGMHFAGSRADRLGYCILASTIVRAFRSFQLTVA